MNCAGCLENLVCLVEGLLDSEETVRCQVHLESCKTCRAEYTAVSSIQRRLTAHGQAAAGISVVDPVMQRIRAARVEAERMNIMSVALKHRWGLGLSFAACAVFFVVLTIFNASKVQASAAAVMTKGADVIHNLSTIHFRGQLRTLPDDNFSYIDAKCDFVPVELWKQFGPELRWRVDKPGRTAVMDGMSTIHFIKPDYALKIGPAPNGAFDTQWLHQMANPGEMLDSELSASKLHGWPMFLTSENSSDGKGRSIVTVEAKASLFAGDYLKNKFFGTADTRRVYTFEEATGLLESVKIYLQADSRELLVFVLDQIDYNLPIDPGVFQLHLPENVTWRQEMQILPDNEKYAAMTAEQAARAFFEACSREDWNEAGKFLTITGSTKEYLGGLQLIKIDDSFSSAISIISGARFVPYEIKLRNGETKKWNLALKKDRTTDRWFVDGGF